MFIRLSLSFISCLIIPALGAGEDFSIPSFWRRPNVTLSMDDRISAATKAVSTFLGRLASDQFGGQEFYAQLADFDAITNQSTYKEDVTRFFTLNVVDFGYQLCVDNALAYGYDALRAYNTYQTPDFLDLAVASWAFGRKYTLSDDQVNSGRTPVKSFDLTAKCGSASMAGGTFWQTDQNEHTLTTFSTGLFFMLSAALNAVSPNATYLSAATQSAQFMLSNFVVLEPNSGRAALSANVSDSCTGDRFGGGSFREQGAGMFIEGLSLLPPDTDIGGTSVADLRRQAVFRTLTGNSKCNTVDGVIDMGNGIGNLEIVRGLGSLYRHNSTKSDLRNFVRDYVGVQYNAVSDRATSGGSIFGGSWAGPPSSTFDGGNQTLALSALINAIPLKFVEDPPSTNSSSTTDSQSGDDKPSNGSSKAGVIAGAVVGVLALVGIIIGVIFLVLRRRRSRKAGSYDLPTDYVPPPPMQGYAPTQPSAQTFLSSQPNILAYPSSPPNTLSYTSSQLTSNASTRLPMQSAVPGAPPPSMVTNRERVVHEPPTHSAYSEKRGLTAHHASAPSESWRSESSGQVPSGSSDISAPAIETADLVRLLAERLDLDRRARSDPLVETAPPAYDVDDGRRR